MAAESAEALFLAKPPFDDIRNVPLRLIVSFGSHVLVCRPDFMARHAYLLAQTLAEHNDALPTPAGAPRELSRRTEDRTPFSPAKRCPMIDDFAAARSTPGIAPEIQQPVKTRICHEQSYRLCQGFA